MIMDCSGSKKVEEVIKKTTNELEKWKNIEISIQKSIDNLEKCLNTDLEIYENFCKFQDSVSKIEILEKKKEILENNEKLNFVKNLNQEFEKIQLEIEVIKSKLESIGKFESIDFEIKNKKDLLKNEKKNLISLQDELYQKKIVLKF